jgi:hypothetical protein
MAQKPCLHGILTRLPRHLDKESTDIGFASGKGTQEVDFKDENDNKYLTPKKVPLFVSD